MIGPLLDGRLLEDNCVGMATDGRSIPCSWLAIGRFASMSTYHPAKSESGAEGQVPILLHGGAPIAITPTRLILDLALRRRRHWQPDPRPLPGATGVRRRNAGLSHTKAGIMRLMATFRLGRTREVRVRIPIRMDRHGYLCFSDGDYKNSTNSAFNGKTVLF